jgi:hypothetical protein
VIVCIVSKAGKLVACWRILDCVVEVEVGCSTLSLVGLFESLRWDTLFAEVSESNLLSAGVYGLGLCAVCNCMAGSTVKGVYGSWIGILGGG